MIRANLSQNSPTVVPACHPANAIHERYISLSTKSPKVTGKVENYFFTNACMNAFHTFMGLDMSFMRPAYSPTSYLLQSGVPDTAQVKVRIGSSKAL
jgi:hypothetical protein